MNKMTGDNSVKAGAHKPTGKVDSSKLPSSESASAPKMSKSQEPLNHSMGAKQTFTTGAAQTEKPLSHPKPAAAGKTLRTS